MKRFYLLLTAFLLSLTAIFAQHNRRVLIEEFTNASCPPCAAQNPAFNVLLFDNYDKVTPIKYQTSFPGFDPMNTHTNGEVEVRRGYYAIDGVPDGYASGSLHMTDYDNPTTPAGLNFFTQAKLDNIYNTLTPVTMQLSHTLSANNDSVFITLKMKSETELTGDLRLHVAVTEEAVVFEDAPGTNGEADFYNVMRKMLPDPQGTAFDTIPAGTELTFNMAWKIGFVFDLNQINVVAWLQNNTTKEVFQSEITKPIGGIPYMSVNFEPNPSASIYCEEAPFAPQVTIENTSATNNLTEVQIAYRINGGTSSEVAWTGNLAPGATTVYTLPTVSLPSVNNIFVVNAVGSNLGIATNLVFPISSTFTIIDPATTATPFTDGFQTTAMPPAGWGLDNLTNGWQSSSTGFGGTAPFRSVRVYFWNLPGGEVDLYLPDVDLSKAASAQLSYDYAYTYYTGGGQTFYDTIQIAASIDCGETWTEIYYKGGAQLATKAAQSASFTPTTAQWKNNTVSLNDFVGQKATLRFRGISGFGNNFYMDNVNITATSSTNNLLNLDGFAVQPNPTNGNSQLRFSLPEAGELQLRVVNVTGAVMQTRNLGELPAGDHQFNIDGAQLPAGSYRIVLQGKDGVAQLPWVVTK